MDIEKLIKISAKVSDVSLIGLICTYLLVAIFSVIDIRVPVFNIGFYAIIIIITSLLLSALINLLLNGYRLFRTASKDKDSFGVLLSIWIIGYPVVAISLPIIVLLTKEHVSLTWLVTFILSSFVLSIIFIKRFRTIGNNFSVSYILLGFALPIFLITSLAYIPYDRAPRVEIIKGSMDQIVTNAMMREIEKRDYANLQNEESIKKIINEINEETGENDTILLSPDNSKWCMKVRLSESYYCVDYNGFRGILENNTTCDTMNGSYSCK